jgi:SAM-dependent methyltransferase
MQSKFTEIQVESAEIEDSGCGCGGSCGCHSGAASGDNAFYNDDAVYNPYADMGMGGNSAASFAGIKEGDTVLDLGSGTGINSLIAREMTGANGKVIGVDVMEAMVNKARANAELAGFNNVEFRLGDVENLPVVDESARVVIGNYAFNMVPDKLKALQETYRVLKHHGNFCFSDIVVRGDMPSGLKADADMYVGCLAGSEKLEDYVGMINEAGFEEIYIHDLKKLELPDAMLHYYLPPEEVQEFKENGKGIFSVTISAEKPCCHAGEEDHVCCGNH